MRLPHWLIRIHAQVAEDFNYFSDEIDEARHSIKRPADECAHEETLN